MPEIEEVGEAEVFDLRDYVRTVWRHRLLIALTVVITVVVAVALSLVQSPTYSANAQLIIQHAGALDSGTQDAQTAERTVDTESAVLESKLVMAAAEKRLGHEPSVSISSSPTSDVVGVSAKSGSAKQAAEDANAYVNAYIALRRSQNIADLLQTGQQLQAKITSVNDTVSTLREGSPELAAAQSQLTFLRQQLDQVQLAASSNQVAGARLLSRASKPVTPVSPKPVRNIALAIVLGLLLGIGLAFLREYLDDTVRSRDDLERAAGGLPVFGEIPRVSGLDDRSESRLVISDAPNSPAAEAYRTLRTSIEFLAFDRGLKTIQVTSAHVDDGKTTTVANLALAFARSGIHVTIVCCDLRRPRIHEFFGLKNEVGFTSVLLGRSAVLDALQQVESEPNLSMLSAGPPPSNPSELLSSRRANAAIASIGSSSNAGLVFVDSPPVLAVGDSLIVSAMVDATLLVANAHSSSRRGLRRAVQMLRQVNAPLIGTVLHNAEISEEQAAYGYGYTAPGWNGAPGSKAPKGLNGLTGTNPVQTRRLPRKENRPAK